MLRRLFILLAKGLLFFVLVWLAVMAYWHYTRRIVSSADLLIYLGLLPIGLLLAYWLTKGGIYLGKQAYSRFQTRAVTKQAEPGSALNAAAPNVPGQETTLLVLANSVRSGMGDAEMWIDKTREYEIHHALDTDLSEALGFGIRSVRMAELDDHDESENMQGAVARMGHMLHLVQDDLSDVMRLAASLAVSGDPKKRLADTRVALHPEWGQNPVPTATEEVPAKAASQENIISNLALFLLLPDFVTAEESDRLKQNCLEWALSLGWPTAAVHVSAVILPDTQASLKKLVDVLRQQSQSPLHLLVVLSAVSWLDESLLNARMQRDNFWADRLRKASTIVGEAAAGMVISNQALHDPETGESQSGLARLTLLSAGERQKPIDAKGSIEAELLVQMAQGIGQSCGVELNQFKYLVATGDFGLDRPVELGRWMSECMPHLNVVGDSLQLGLHVGECEPVSDLLGMALAVEHCRQAEAPILFCSNHSTSWRGMLAALPIAVIA